MCSNMQAPHIHMDGTTITLQGSSESLVIRNEGNGDAFFMFRGSCQSVLASRTSTNGSLDHALARPAAVAPWLNIAPFSGCIAARSQVKVVFAVNKTAASFLADDTGRNVVEVRCEKFVMLLLQPAFHCQGTVCACAAKGCTFACCPGASSAL